MNNKLTVIKICSVLLFSSLLFGGCQKAPEEVQERMEDYGENKQIKAGEINYCMVDELKEVDVSAVNERLDNMELPEDADFSEVQDIAVLQMAYADDYIEEEDRLVKLFGIDRSTIHTNDHGIAQTDLRESDDPANRKYFSVQNNGFVSFITGMTYAKIKDEVKRVDTPETYVVGEDDLSQKNMSFDQEVIPITDMIDIAESWLEKNMPLDELRYRISNVYVRNLKLSKGSGKQLSLFSQIDYKGVPLNSYVAKFADDDTANSVLSCTGVHLNYEGREQLTFFANYNGRINFRSAEPVEKVIDLESAARLVNEKIAGFNKFRVSKLLPMYALFPKYKEKGVFAFSTPGQEVEGRPVYAFLINMEYGGISDFGINIMPEHYALVDMVTGEITTDFEDVKDKE